MQSHPYHLPTIRSLGYEKFIKLNFCSEHVGTFFVLSTFSSDWQNRLNYSVVVGIELVKDFTLLIRFLLFRFCISQSEFWLCCTSLWIFLKYVNLLRNFIYVLIFNNLFITSYFIFFQFRVFLYSYIYFSVFALDVTTCINGFYKKYRFVVDFLFIYRL